MRTSIIKPINFLWSLLFILLTSNTQAQTAKDFLVGGTWLGYIMIDGKPTCKIQVLTEENDDNTFKAGIYYYPFTKSGDAFRYDTAKLFIHDNDTSAVFDIAIPKEGGGDYCKGRVTITKPDLTTMQINAKYKPYNGCNEVALFLNDQQTMLANAVYSNAPEALAKQAVSKTAGTVAPDAIVINADEIYPFRQGSALIQKGDAYALIDGKGKYVVPFNVYQEIRYSRPQSDKVPSTNGIYIVHSKQYQNFALINAKGKIIYVPERNSTQELTTGYGDNGFASLEYGFAPINGIIPTKQVSISPSGNKVFFENCQSLKWNEGIASYTEYALSYISNDKTGFKDSSGKIIIPPSTKIILASVFSEGLVAVAEKNEFGELKWGYINMAGNVVIPFKYSKQPGDFGNGLAAITPVTKDNYDFAVINKKGEIVFTVPLNSNFSSNIKFQNGYAFSGDMVIDTTGKIFPATDFLKLFGLPTTYHLITIPFYNNQMLYFPEGSSTVSKAHYGILDFKTKKALPALYDDLSFFDPVSNLAYAKMFIRHDAVNNRDIYREGYINKEGEFVIVKGEAEKF